jgi:hypothetical protein
MSPILNLPTLDAIHTYALIIGAGALPLTLTAWLAVQAIRAWINHHEHNR